MHKGSARLSILHREKSHQFLLPYVAAKTASEVHYATGREGPPPPSPAAKHRDAFGCSDSKVGSCICRSVDPKYIHFLRKTASIPVKAASCSNAFRCYRRETWVVVCS